MIPVKNIHKTVSLLLSLTLCLVLLASCGGKPAEKPAEEKAASGSAIAAAPSPQTPQPTAASGKRVITDMSGAQVEIPAQVKKVVNLWPASNAAMLAMGAGELLAGTHAYTKTLHWSHYVYPGLKDVPTATNNAEELMKLSPDLIITSGDDAAKTLRNAGLPAVNMMFSNFDSMKKAFKTLGEAFGQPYADKVAAWSKLVDANIARVQKAVGDIPEDKKPVVYYIQGSTLYDTFAADSIMNDWTTIAGGVFASKKLNLTSNKVTPEEILKLNPDIVIIGTEAQHKLYDEIMASKEWADIKAVKNKRVYTNPLGLFSWERFGMESALQIPYAATIIQPELFKADMAAETKEFYKTFVGVELTDKQAENMLKGYGPNGEAYQ